MRHAHRAVGTQPEAVWVPRLALGFPVADERIARSRAPRDGLGLTTPKYEEDECERVRWSACHMFGRVPNGSRLSCGRLARRRKGRGRQSVPRQGHNTPLPLKRSPPASFKRLLGGLGGTIEEVYHTRPQTVLGTDYQ